MKITSGSVVSPLQAGKTRGWMKRTLQAAVLVAVAASVPAAWSAGGGPVQVTNVAAGSAAFSQAGVVTTVRTGSANTIINYSRLDVPAGDTLQFLQPNAASRVLNRVNSPDPSHIDGTLRSNGIVYLVNPSGVMFGQGAVVDAAQFFAAASHISDQNFLSGVNLFANSTGTVQNLGTLRAGQVHLVGGQVGNGGLIISDGSAGIVTMSAGKDVYIGEVNSPVGTPRVTVKISGSPAAGSGPAVANTGGIHAPGGQVLLGAGDVYGMAIMNSGAIQAGSITLQGGQGIVQAGGTLDASSATGNGGSVKVLGEKVAVTGTIDASGATGGGAVRIGGDFHGQGTLPTATDALVTATGTIKADATVSGDGGTVVVWSNNNTMFAGNIFARGAGTGNGGSVEVSGHNLGLVGTIDVTSPGGMLGTVLLDPDTLTIDNVGTNDASFTGNIAFADLPTTMSISAAKLVTLLETSALTLQANNLIDVTVNVDSSGDALTAGHGVTLQVGGSGVIKLESGVTVRTNNATLHFIGAVQTGGGSVTADAGTGALTIDKTVTDLGTTALSLSGNTVTLSNTVNVAGALTVTSNSGATNLTVANNITAAAITLTTGKTLALNAGVTLDTSGSNGNITLMSKDLNLSGTAAITAGTGDVSFFSFDPTQNIGLPSGGTLNITAANLGIIGSAAHIIIGDPTPVTGESGTITATKFDAHTITIPIVLNAPVGAGGVVLDDTSGGSATALHTGAGVTINAGTGGITAASATNTTAEIDAAGAVSLNSTSGVIGTNTNRIQFAAGDTGISAATSGTIFLQGLGNISFGTVTSSAAISNLTTRAGSNGNLNATGTLSGNTLVLNADGGIGTTAPVSISSAGAIVLITAGSGAAGNMTVTTGAAALADPGITVNAGGGQTISLTSGPLSFTTPLVLGTSTANLVLSATSLNVGGAATITANNFTVTGIGAGAATIAGTLTLSGSFLSNGTGDFTLTGGSITAGTVRITAANVTDGGTGAITATNLGVIASGNVTLTNAAGNNVGTFAASGASGSGITFENSSALTVGSVSSVSNFAGATGVTTSGGGAVTLQSTGTLTISQVVTGGTAGVSLTTVTSGNINGTATVSGGPVSVVAAGGIGLTGSGLSINSTGTGAVTLTTAGLAAAGNITVTTGASTLDTPVITVNAGGGQTVTLTAGALTLGNTPLAGANLSVTATSLAVTAGTTVTADNFSAALTNGVSIAGTLTLTGDFNSTGTTFDVAGTGSVTSGAGGNINILHTGAITLAGSLDATATGTVRIAGTGVSQTGGTITASNLAVRAAGAVTLNQSNPVGHFGAVDTSPGGAVSFTDSGAFDLNTVTGVAAAAPFPAFLAVSGITTSNGGVALNSPGTATISNPIAAGTGTVQIFTTVGDVDINAAVTGGTVNLAAAGNVTLAALVTADNAGSGVLTSWGTNFSITAAGSFTTDGTAVLIHSGTVSFAGNATAGTFAVQGTSVTQTTGTITANELGVRATTGAITLPNITLSGGNMVLAATADTAGQNVTITSTGGVKVGTVGDPTDPTDPSGPLSSVDNTNTPVAFALIHGLATGGVAITSLTATTGNITGTATGPVTGDTVNVTATVGAIGVDPPGQGLIINSTTLATLTTGGAHAGGDIHITTTGATLAGLTFVTDAATVQTITVDKAGALTINGAVGTANDNLTVTTSGALTINNNVNTGTGSLTLQGGTLGVANLSFGPGVTLTAPTILLEAGTQSGSDSTSSVNLVANVPTISGTSALTIRQDASITDAVIDGSTLGGSKNYTLHSDGGDVTVATAGHVTGTILTLTATSTGPGNVNINGALNLASLVSNGTTNLGAGVTTVADQTYNGNVVLMNTVALAGGNVTFTGTVTSQLAQGFSLTVTASGTVAFDGSVGGVAFAGSELGQLNLNGTGNVQLGSAGPVSVTTLIGQTYNLPVNLKADATFTNLVFGTIAFDSAVEGAQALTVSLGSTVAFNSTVGSVTPLTSLTTTSATLTQINGGAVKTSGAQDYGAATIGTLAATLTSTGGSAITFHATLGGPQALAFSTSGAAIFDGAVGGGGNPLASLDTTGAGSTQIDGGAITTSSAQNYGPTTIGTLAATLTSTAAGSITFHAALDGPQGLTVSTASIFVLDGLVGNSSPLAFVDSTGTLVTGILGGGVITSGNQDYGNALIGTLAATLTSTGAGTITFHSSVGGPQALAVSTGGLVTFDGPVGGAGNPLDSLTTTGAGTTQINGGAVTTVGAQDYGAATLGTMAATLTSTGAGSIRFHATLDGPQALTVSTTGIFAFDGLVGSSSALAFVDTTGAGVTGILGGGVTTSGNQDYGTALIGTLAATLTSTGAGTITFHSSVGGPQSLALSTGGLATFDGQVGGGGNPLQSLTTTGAGTTQINGGGVTTVAAQDYGATTLGGSLATLTGTAITFHSTLGGPQGLATAGTTVTFDAAVGGGGNALANLDTTGSGTTQINGGAVTTSGAQGYGAATLGTMTATLTSSGGSDITFLSTLGGPQGLTVTTTGALVFDGTVGGGGNALASLTATGAGTTQIDGGAITTTGLQDYGVVTIGTSAATLTSSGGNAITFESTVRGPKALTVATAGTVTFNGIVGGGGNALASLTTTGAGLTQLDGGAVTTSGAQDYGATTLGTLAAMLTSSGGSNITFHSTLKGPQALTASTTGALVFDGAVGGGGNALASLTATAAGTTQINGGAVTTSGLQNYGAVTLGTLAATLTSSGGSGITFTSTVKGPQALTVVTTGAVAFNGAVGGAGNALARLTTTGAGVTHITGSAVTTAGTQDYGVLTLGTLAATLTSTGNSAITFHSTVDGPQGLTVATGGAITFDNLVGNGTPLASLTTGSGTAQIVGGLVHTTGDQHFNGPVTLAANTAFSGGNILFASSLNSSGSQRNVTTSGTSVSFAGPTGNTLALNDLTSSSGLTSFAGAFTAAGNISAPGAVALGGSAVLTAGGSGGIVLGNTALGGSAVVTASGAGGITLGNVSGPSSAGLRLVTTSGSSPFIVVGAIGSSGASIGDLEFDSAYVTNLGGDIFANSITFAGPAGGAIVTPPIATVFHSTGNLAINTSGENANGLGLEMFQGQKLSVFDHAGVLPGNLTIISNNHSVQIADLSALGQITINTGSVAQSIKVVARNGAMDEKNDGTLVLDHGTDIVSGAAGANALDFTGTVVLVIPAGVTAASLVQFSSPLGEQNLMPSATFRFNILNGLGIKVLTENQTDPITVGSFTDGAGKVLDLYAVGVGNPVSSVGVVVAQELQLLAPERNEAISGALRDALQELGIYARELRTDELLQLLLGRALYDDVPYQFNPPANVKYQVASNRLPYSPVIPIVEAYESLFFKPMLDKDGKPMLDEHGNPKKQDQSATIKDAFGQTWQLYLTDMKAQAKPEGFRAYLEAHQKANPKCAAALGYLNSLRSLLTQIKTLGLTDTEFAKSQSVIFLRVRPANIREADFATAIMGPSTPAKGTVALR